MIFERQALSMGLFEVGIQNYVLYLSINFTASFVLLPNGSQKTQSD